MQIQFLHAVAELQLPKGLGVGQLFHLAGQGFNQGGGAQLQAFTDQQLKERNIESVYDIASFTPNFQMNRNLGRRLDRPIIRPSS